MKMLHSSSSEIKNYYSEIFAKSFPNSTDIAVIISGIKSADSIFLTISISFTCQKAVFEEKYEKDIKNFIQRQLKYQNQYSQRDFFSKDNDNIMVMKNEILGQVDKLPPQTYYLLHRKD